MSDSTDPRALLERYVAALSDSNRAREEEHVAIMKRLIDLTIALNQLQQLLSVFIEQLAYNQAIRSAPDLRDKELN